MLRKKLGNQLNLKRLDNLVFFLLTGLSRCDTLGYQQKIGGLKNEES